MRAWKWILAGLMTAGMVGAQDLSGWDADGDGNVSRDEFQGPAKLFERLDANADGILTAAEMQPLDERSSPRERDTAPRRDKDGQDRGAQLRARFDEQDADGDGMLNRDEFPRPEAFDKLDGDGDGLLSFDELASKLRDQAPDGAARFREADVDGDGQLSAEEFPGPPEMFARLDTDGDGVLGEAEIRAGLQQRQRGQRIRKALQRLDSDGDGMLSSDEWVGERLPDFAEVDSNGDGLASPDELQAYAAARRGQADGQRDRPQGDKPKRDKPRD